MNKFNFFSNPFRYIYTHLIYPHLPFSWKIKVLYFHINWMERKRTLKNQLLGKLVVIVVSVDKDWEYVQGQHTQVRVRDISYRWKREKLPFTYSKLFRGTQCTDETAHPLRRIPHSLVASINDQIFVCNQGIQAFNEKYERHQELKASIVNHKFQEYDHESKN